MGMTFGGYLSSSKVWDEGKGKTEGGKNSLKAAVRLWVGRNKNFIQFYDTGKEKEPEISKVKTQKVFGISQLWR